MDIRIGDSCPPATFQVLPRYMVMAIFGAIRTNMAALVVFALGPRSNPQRNASLWRLWSWAPVEAVRVQVLRGAVGGRDDRDPAPGSRESGEAASRSASWEEEPGNLFLVG